MGWFSLRNACTILTFVPVVGVVGALGNIALDLSDEETRKTKSIKDWLVDAAGVGLCVIPGGGAANGAVKIARATCAVIDKGGIAIDSYNAGKDIYQNGVSPSNIVGILSGVSGFGKGKIASKAGELATAGSLVTMAQPAGDNSLGENIPNKEIPQENLDTMPATPIKQGELTKPNDLGGMVLAMIISAMADKKSINSGSYTDKIGTGMPATFFETTNNQIIASV